MHNIRSPFRRCIAPETLPSLEDSSYLSANLHQKRPEADRGHKSPISLQSYLQKAWARKAEGIAALKLQPGLI